MAVVVISSWGRLTHQEHDVKTLFNRTQISHILKNNGPGIAYGMGRSYGDVCLNPHGTLWKTTGLDRFINFNAETGSLTCESGVLLHTIQTLLIPRGWTLPVTPGTQFVTIGGAIANDVHGKSHHVCGSFGNHIKKFSLMRTNGEIIECSPHKNSDWFAATIGGIGLTGIILTAEIQLQPILSPWIISETIPYSNLDEFFKLTEESEINWKYIVSWIDCIHKKHRGIFLRGNPTEIQKNLKPKSHKITIPFVPPISLVNRLSLPLFNSAYYKLHKMKPKRSIAHYESFFYPLDNLLEWNRFYGPKGFFQYQIVVPNNMGREAIKEILQEICKSGEGSFLAVLKIFGNQNSIGMMSFPQPGITLALDFPNKGQKTLKLFERLDAILHIAKGRIYLAKDACMPRALFEMSYPRLSEFLSYRDPKISSSLSRRLMGY